MMDDKPCLGIASFVVVVTPRRVEYLVQIVQRNCKFFYKNLDCTGNRILIHVLFG